MLTINGHDVFGGQLGFPRQGVWHASLRADATDLQGAVAIVVDEKTTLRGTVRRGGDWQETDAILVYGGAGRLGTRTTPKHYVGTTVGLLLADLLRNVGETLSPTSEQAVLSQGLPAWTVVKMATSAAISRLLEVATPGAAWRILPDGTLWVGRETWPDSGLDETTAVTISEEPEKGEATLALDSLTLMPGTLFGGRRVSYVEHVIGSPTVRTWVQFEKPGDTTDRLKGSFRKIVRGAQNPTEYLGLHMATVVSQAGGTIDVAPVNSSRVPPMSGVPLFASPAQWSMILQSGGRVLVGWSSGDPSQPFAVAFDANVRAQVLSIATSLSLTLSSLTVTIGDDTLAQPSIISTPYLAAEAGMIDALCTGLQAALSGLGLAPAAAALASAQAAFHGAAATFISTQVRNS